MVKPMFFSFNFFNVFQSHLLDTPVNLRKHLNGLFLREQTKKALLNKPFRVPCVTSVGLLM